MRQWPSEDFTLPGPRSEAEQHIEVALPARYGKLENPPVIVCLDGPWVFGTVSNACRVMSFAGEAPEAVVVGLSFITDSGTEYTKLRARWFTPTAFVPPVATGVKGVQADYCGHADTMIEFLVDDLLPELERRYGSGERWYVGHSFSALLGVNAMLQRPGLFDRWLLASTSIWWDDRVILEREQAYADTHDDLSASVFLCAGSDEVVADGDGNQYDMVTNVAELADRLGGRNYPSLQLTHTELPHETHSSAIGAAVSAGLRALLAHD